MTVTLTYDSQLSRVRITADGLGGADTALVERSTNQVTWATVRGGAAATVASGALAVPVDDYEWVPGVPNYYRVTTAKDASILTAGAAAHADNASVTPALPAGAAAGDLLLIWAAIRNTAANPNTPTGYLMLANLVNVRLYGKIHTGTESAPTVTFTGGAAGDTTSAQMTALRNVSGAIGEFAFNALNASQQDIPYPALTVATIHAVILYLAWKQDDWTGVATLAGDGGTAVEIGDPSSTLGNDQGIVWDGVVQTTTNPTNVAAGSFTVTGGAAAISRSLVMSFQPALLQQTNSITPVLTEVWIKSVARPFLNKSVKPLRHVSWRRRSRGAAFDVIGRSLPVAVTDVRSGRENLTIQIPVDTAQERNDLDQIFSAGDTIFLHCPPSYPVPSMYAAIGDVEFDERRGVFTLPLTEVAAPAAGVVGATITWQGVVNTYATWSALVAAETTWADLLENIGTPTDVIVP